MKPELSEQQLTVLRIAVWGEFPYHAFNEALNNHAQAAFALGHAAGQEAMRERAETACKEWGNAKVQKWSEIGDESMVEDAKSRAWDGLQCAAAIRALEIER